MIEWLAILLMAALGFAAFAILFQTTAPGDTSELESEKLRQDLAKMAKDESRKKEGQVRKQEQKKKDEKRKKAENLERQLAAERELHAREEGKKKGRAANKSPPRERYTEAKEEKKEQKKEQKKEEKKEEKSNRNAVLVPNIPVQNNTPTIKAKSALPRSPTKTKEEIAKKEVPMPSKKDIERALRQGFVVVQKKGPQPLTPEQRKEREELRQREEEEERRKETEAIEREKERQKRRTEAATATEVNALDVKAKIDKQKQERQSKEEERKKVNCVIKEYTKMSAEAEENEKRSWGAAALAESEDAPAYDAEDYPRLQPTD